MTETLFDCVIVGAGPGGLSAAMMLGRARRRVLVLDDGTACNRFAAHTHAVIGFDGAPPEELRRRGRRGLSAYDVTFVEARVMSVEFGDEDLIVRSAATEYRTRTVIDAVGAGDDLVPVDGLPELWGAKVLHCPYCHGCEVRDKRLAVIATPLMGLFQAKLLRQWSGSLTAFVADAGPVDDDALGQIRAVGTAVVDSPVRSVSMRADGAVDITTHDKRVTTVGATFTGSTVIPRDSFLPADLRRGPAGFLRLDDDGRATDSRIWSVGNAASPYANVPMRMGNGSAVGGADNLHLVEEDAQRASAHTSGTVPQRAQWRSPATTDAERLTEAAQV